MSFPKIRVRRKEEREECWEASTGRGHIMKKMYLDGKEPGWDRLGDGLGVRDRDRVRQ